ncbi:MAG: MBL fold metallo-hydrolase [Chloracidobacterium sp.]|uniref:MBL fold metallo-hydrolase n=1 Tax=Chloracidobacterium validum TaxID=2821543 RepID=A0ABX8BC04_9BACT|nr:MBL fold metallo-hydrolase [Chloracidobacterium validum]QUW03164.1 MBL fold metallo-hydrolase [Chloracidobacterium validum]
MGLTLGDVELDIVSDGTFRLDGGAMFGVVPRVLWERVAPPDEKHRIVLGLNTLLVRTPHDTILVDTGIGTKWSAKHIDMYGIAHETTVPQSLAALGLTPEDVTLVINTHLHFDHAGGNTYRTEQGTVRPTFPKARYVIQRAEYEHAQHPHERDRASYLREDWEPVAAAGQFVLVEGEVEVSPGVWVVPVRGHNDFTQCVRVSSGGQTAFYWADILPTTAHLPFAWVMGYDLYPVELLENKKRLIPQSAAERWLNIFEHDHACPWGYIVATEGGKYAVQPVTN